MPKKPKVISRKESKEKGLIKFFTGVPCNHGHVDYRFVSTGSCYECGRMYGKKEREKHKGTSSPSAVRWRKENREYDLERKRKWARENRDRIRSRESYRRGADPAYRAKCQCQNMLHRTLRMTGKRKTTRTEKHLGYTKEDLISHIESLFEEGMCWENFGRGPGSWNIDHIKPISAFVSEGESEPSVINALSNLQPLWFEDNAAKSDNWTD